MNFHLTPYFYYINKMKTFTSIHKCDKIEKVCFMEVVMNTNEIEKYKNNETIIANEERILEVTRYIGRNSNYIRKALRDVMITAWGKTMMVKPLQSNKDDKGRVTATTRMMHYANAAWIAGQIASGLFPEDKYIKRGVSTTALGHDLGQDAYGHDGETARAYASEQNNGGAMLHNIEGMMKFIFRYADKIKEAMIEGRILEEEAKKRNISQDELKRRLEMGLEPELYIKIQAEYDKNGELAEEAVKLMAVSAGNHNGERGIANIIPDYERTFEEVFETAERTYIDANEDKNMKSCSIVDAIVKISDQISSITLDIIDAKRAGIEDEIFEGWAEPIAKILQITEEEAKLKLKGNDEELRKMVHDLQVKLIENIIESSNTRKINMSLAPWVYGRTDKDGQVITNGLRTFNMREHTTYTSTVETEVLLKNIMSELTEILSKSVLEKGIFSTKLNEVFRISSKNPIRKSKENFLLDNYIGEPALKEFYEYVVKLSSEEYQFNKRIVKKREMQYFRKIIEKTLERRDNLMLSIEPRSARNSTPYLIEEYILSPNYLAMKQNEKGEYDDSEILDMIERINIFLHSNPIETKNHLSLLVEKNKYQIGAEGEAEKISLGKVLINTDQQIAARLALSYLNMLNDEQLLNLAFKMRIINEEEMNLFKRPYSIYSGKRTGRNGYVTSAMKIAKEDYKQGENSGHEVDETNDDFDGR